MPTVYVDEEGVRHEILELADCNCMFELTFTIKDLLPQDFNHVVFNGLEVEEAGGQWPLMAEEIEIDYDLDIDSLRRVPD